MDPSAVGAIVGTGIIITIFVSLYIYGKCKDSKELPMTNPLIIRKRSFKVKSLFK